MAVNSQNGGASNNDSFDINELAYLDEEITPELIEQLQKNITQSAIELNNNDGKLDVNMFEEILPEPQVAEKSPQKLAEQKEAIVKEESIADTSLTSEVANISATEHEQTDNTIENTDTIPAKEPENSSIEENKHLNSVSAEGENNSIENLSQGNITERAITQAQLDYNASLDYADGNTKYSKYIIYIAPENTEFIESLTVKERKNLINKILNEQGNIILNKKKTDFIKTVFQQVIIAIITLAIMIPVMYKIFNFSIEATIDNDNRAKSNFQTLYKEHGKIKQLR